MVIGSGMIAKTFSSYTNNDNVVIFASGVSNSKEELDANFEKEIDLLVDIHLKNLDKKFIYFSTISIDDKSLCNSKYINHKIDVEKIISNFDNYIIFRLPNIIGKTDNNNTFFNFFRNKIKNGEEIQIQRNASRYIIDVEDVFKYLSPLIDSGFVKNETINVCFDEKIKMPDLIECFEKVMNIDAKKKIVESGYDYVVDNKEFLFLISNMYEKSDFYIYKTIEKYINV